ncbi:unnamed protein product [Penicillium discolor]
MINRSTSKDPDVMAGNVTTDINEIAKRIGSITFGSSSVGTGSYWNLDGLTDNCVFVSRGFLAGMPAPELSRRMGIKQTRNESGGLAQGGDSNVTGENDRVGTFFGI